MSARNYELKQAFSHITVPAHAELTVLSNDVPGQAMVVEKVGIYTSVAGSYLIRKYDGTDMRFEWDTGNIPVFETREFPGPWVLLGDSSDAQSLRVEFSAASNTLTTVSASYSSE